MNDADCLSVTRYSRSTRLTIPTFLAMKGARLPDRLGLERNGGSRRPHAVQAVGGVWFF
jgi:hypothetical protein